MERIEKTYQFLKDKLAESAYYQAHPTEPAYRIEHSCRVAQIGREIAAHEGLNEENMVLACLLHDVGYCHDFSTDGAYREHGRISARVARPFLEGLDLPRRDIDEMLYGIAIHVDDKADFDGERTVFALTVSDADNIDRFDAYRIYETLQFVHYDKMNFQEKRAHILSMREKLSRYAAMPTATKTAEALWHDRIAFYSAFYDRLLWQAENGEMK